MNLPYHIHTYSYILEQLCSPAPREWVHPCLVLGKDCLPFHIEGLCCPLPFPSLVWPLGLPQFLLSTTCLFQRFIHHTFKSPYNCYTSLNTSAHVEHYGHMTRYTSIHSLQSFFLFSFLTSKQVSWPWALMLGTGRVHKKREAKGQNQRAGVKRSKELLEWSRGWMEAEQVGGGWTKWAQSVDGRCMELNVQVQK
jgi:hypothetical protein